MPICKILVAFDRSGKFIEEKPMTLTSGSATMYVTAQIKVKMFDDFGLSGFVAH